MEIVHEYSIKLDKHQLWGKAPTIYPYPNVTHTDTEKPIEDWVTGRRSDERGSSHGDQRCGENALKRPVIRAMRPGWRREQSRVIY